MRCAACEQRIPDHEPDLVLENLSTERQRYYHTFCEGAADCFWRLLKKLER